VWLAWRAAHDGLGANPIEAATHATGDWALRFLLASLAVTPVRRWLGWRDAIAYRRTLGLAAFAYAALHFAIWSVVDLGLDGAAIVEDIAERPFVTVGFAAFLLLAPLAATSTRAAMRRLGRNWVRLHRLVYVAAGLAVVHYLWLVKADLREPLLYAGVLGVLLAARVPTRTKRARSQPQASEVDRDARRAGRVG
jgi:sulfoxide reductase heme-binding subunit YedZ